MQKKIERAIYIDDAVSEAGEECGYFVRFCFKNKSHTRHFATLEQAREYRDEMEKAKVEANILEDKKDMLDFIEQEVAKTEPWPFNMYKAMGLSLQDIPSVLSRYEEFKNPADFVDFKYNALDMVILDMCKEREAFAIYGVYLEGRTLEAIGKELNVTRERVRQIIVAGLKKIRHAILRYEADREFEARMDMRRDLINALRESGVLTDDMQYEFGPLRMWKNEGSDENYEVISIEDLDLSIRSYNCLKRAGIDTVNELVELTLDDLYKIKNMGKKSLREIRSKLGDVGLRLKGDNGGRI